MGGNYLKTGKITSAVEHLETAVKLEANDAEIRNDLGVAYWKLNRYPEAVTEFKKAIKIDPMYAKAFNNLGRLFVC